MKIGPIDTKPVSPAQGNDRADRKGGPAASTTPAPEASTQVALSPAASLLAKAADDGSFDAAKVERIAAAIREGKYQVNAEAIADKLIINAEELLGRKLG
jgi:negative regulator of flagellin synthesis FlgM